VIAVDGLQPRHDLAARLGAEQVLDPADGEIAERIHDLTDGRGADACLEISGNYAALHEGCAGGVA
jgi:Zn-dependent alcohol dehydrogenase